MFTVRNRQILSRAVQNDDGKDGDGNTVSKRKKPGDGNGKKEAKAAAPKRCRKDSSGGKGIACKKVKP